MTVDVEVYLFGEFRVVVRGRALGVGSWRRKTARQLLKCLLSRPGRRLLKDEAIELLWPEGEPSTGDANLRSTLTALRQALEPIELITINRDSIGVRPDANLWADADAFEDLLDQADYLVEDLYADWASERRDALKRAWVELQLTLARLAEGRGTPDRAVAALERVQRADPSDERAAQELMQLFDRLRRRTDALRIFQTLEQALRDDLGVEPSPSTLELRRQIVASLDAPGVVEPAHASSPSRPAGAGGLPTGTVTFLLSDVEGSSGLREADPEAMRGRFMSR